MRSRILCVLFLILVVSKAAAQDSTDLFSAFADYHWTYQITHDDVVKNKVRDVIGWEYIWEKKGQFLVDSVPTVIASFDLNGNLKSEVWFTNTIRRGKVVSRNIWTKQIDTNSQGQILGFRIYEEYDGIRRLQEVTINYDEAGTPIGETRRHYDSAISKHDITWQLVEVYEKKYAFKEGQRIFPNSIGNPFQDPIAQDMSPESKNYYSRWHDRSDEIVSDNYSMKVCRCEGRGHVKYLDGSGSPIEVLYDNYDCWYLDNNGKVLKVESTEDGSIIHEVEYIYDEQGLFSFKYNSRSGGFGYLGYRFYP
ncbi:hypothetical protein [Sanyastnella coralliicola]|uniref:hypothetical protein n=1 Tax=Sanyastnella coralliicola TaxID=3069118 RepID=UPI0027B9C543|nr:hypothetical protein [Longitalea sp. SCSIO 12813]